MANEKKCCEFFSSPLYTNILLTVIVIMLIGGAICKHMCMSKGYPCMDPGKAMMGQKGMMMGGKGMMGKSGLSVCPVTAPQAPEAEK
ncbi:MAG: hypothetical protein Q8L26_04500 [Candidatus Omnitrophota bacterium]|nr:hypothetical protein [Candidatus Omnitrophota bacterium]